MSIFKDRIEAVRAMMRSKGWDAVIVTGNDPHNSEYSAARWHQAAWLSGYTGEGDLVITEDRAGLGLTLVISSRPLSSSRPRELSCIRPVSLAKCLFQSGLQVILRTAMRFASLLTGFA